MVKTTAYSYGSGSIYIPNPAPPTYSTFGYNLTGYKLTFYDPYDASTVALNGNTMLYNSDLTIADQSLGIGTPGPLQNNGSLYVMASTLTAGTLSGHGSVIAYQGGLNIASAPTTSETIQIHSSALHIGAGGIPNPGMQFLAPVTGFDTSSVISLEDTAATLEVYFRQSGALYLFDGPNMVAHMTVKGSPTVYATQLNESHGAPTVALSAYDTSFMRGAIPMALIG